MEGVKLGTVEIEKAMEAIKDVADGSIGKLKTIDWDTVGDELADLDSDEIKKLLLEVLVIVWNILKGIIEPKTLLILLLKMRK